MPQMMPCSWLMVFFMSILIFLTVNSGWSTFFFISSFPSEHSSCSSMKKSFFN